MNIFLENLKEYYFLHRNKINMYVVFFIICTIFLIIFYSVSLINKKNNDKKISYDEPVLTEKEEINEYIYVDIKGSVNKEGVYKVINGSRVFDLIETAGGLKQDANTRFINLSKVLNDGEVVIIYSNSEIEEAKKSDIVYIETPCICKKVENDACLNENTGNTNTLININNATKEQLETLTGIGESKATAIIEYRNSNGKFNKIEDILNVSGISETIFDKIKTLITV